LDVDWIQYCIGGVWCIDRRLEWLYEIDHVMAVSERVLVWEFAPINYFFFLQS
jgi:hypothetical protein